MKMRKILTLAAVALIMGGTLVAKYRPAVAEETAATAVNEKLPTLIDLSAEWCSACQAQKKILEEYLPKYGHNFNMQFVDVNKDEELAQKYQIRVIPTLIFLSPEGEVIKRNEGVMEGYEISYVFKNAGYEMTEKK